jgi:serine/threonine-protein kinase
LVREYVGGQPVRAWLSDLAPGTWPPILQVAKIATGILEGLAYAHNQGIVHGHIQPKNIILSENRVKIMNFGLADPAPDTWTHTDIAYMAPEQLTGQEPSACSDLYSLGIFVYEMLTRKLPFEAETRSGLIARCITHPPQPPSELNPEIPPQMEELLLALLSKESENRPQTAGKVLRRLAKGWAELANPESVRQFA